MLVLTFLFACLALLASAISIGAWRRLAVLRREFDEVRVRLKTLQSNTAHSLNRLTEFAAKNTNGMQVGLPILCASQHGEDAWLWAEMGFKTTGFYVEAGASDGITFSNSYFFESIGWNGLLIEPHPNMFEECLSLRQNSIVKNVALSDRSKDKIVMSIVSGANGVELLSFTDGNDAHKQRVDREGGRVTSIEVFTETLDNLLEECGATKVDFLSLDIEGAELAALRGFSLDRWKPEYLLIEDNSNGEDKSVRNWLNVQHYIFATRLGVNDVYKRSQ